MGLPILLKRSQIHECRKWETEIYNSVLEITKLHSFISESTSIGTGDLYWILTGPSFGEQVLIGLFKLLFYFVHI